jgi:hypothetical protein
MQRQIRHVLSPIHETEAGKTDANYDRHSPHAKCEASPFNQWHSFRKIVLSFVKRLYLLTAINEL